MTSVLSGGVAGSFLRYRILAFTTGTLLVLLFFVAIPIQLWGHNKGPETVVGTTHGLLFMVYLVAAFDLGIRLRWPWLKLGLVMLAGIVPVMTFYAEHRAHADVLTRTEPAPAADLPTV